METGKWAIYRPLADEVRRQQGYFQPQPQPSTEYRSDGAPDRARASRMPQ